MAAYYNEFDRYVAQWLRNLIADGLIAAGDVDERSIADVRPEDLRGYTQHHFFAGLGGWAYALRLAGWPDDRPVWTGSCPCQPFSNVGKREGRQDSRHLWPVWHRLIRELAPDVLFGEQVAGAVGFSWLDHVLADMENEGYAVGTSILPACAVGAPHIRQRLWFVADASGATRQQDAGSSLGDEGKDGRRKRGNNGYSSDGENRAGLLDDAIGARLEGFPGHEHGRGGRSGQAGSTAETGPSNPWAELEWLPCSDGKLRPTQPGLFPLAHGVSGRMAIRRTVIENGAEVEKIHWYSRVGALRGFGNAIVPQEAAEFIAAYMDLER